MIRYLLFVFLFASSAQARVFDINSERFAGYFTFSGGSSALATKALVGEAPGAVSYSGSVNYNYSGEFGMIYTRPRGSLRFGFEILRPFVLDSSATSGSNELYSAHSEILGYAPKLALEINVHGNKTSRSYISLGVGAGNISLKNSYQLKPAGQAAYAGVTDHTVEAKGSATMLAGALGYEGHLTDTTTFTVEFGYRQLKFDNLTYAKDVTTFAGPKTAGDKVQTISGENRALDLGGGYVAIGFRFYL